MTIFQGDPSTCTTSLYIPHELTELVVNHLIIASLLSCKIERKFEYKTGLSKYPVHISSVVISSPKRVQSGYISLILFHVILFLHIFISSFVNVGWSSEELKKWWFCIIFEIRVFIWFSFENYLSIKQSDYVFNIITHISP